MSRSKRTFDSVSVAALVDELGVSPPQPVEPVRADERRYRHPPLVPVLGALSLGQDARRRIDGVHPRTVIAPLGVDRLRCEERSRMSVRRPGTATGLALCLAICTRARAHLQPSMNVGYRARLGRHPVHTDNAGCGLPTERCSGTPATGDGDARGAAVAAPVQRDRDLVERLDRGDPLRPQQDVAAMRRARHEEHDPDGAAAGPAGAPNYASGGGVPSPDAERRRRSCSASRSGARTETAAPNTARPAANIALVRTPRGRTRCAHPARAVRRPGSPATPRTRRATRGSRACTARRGPSRPPA